MELGELQHRLEVLERAVFNGKFISAEVYKVQIDSLISRLIDYDRDSRNLKDTVDKNLATKEELNEVAGSIKFAFRSLLGALLAVGSAIVTAIVTRGL